MDHVHANVLGQRRFRWLALDVMVECACESPGAPGPRSNLSFTTEKLLLTEKRGDKERRASHPL